VVAITAAGAIAAVITVADIMAVAVAFTAAGVGAAMAGVAAAKAEAAAAAAAVVEAVVVVEEGDNPATPARRAQTARASTAPVVQCSSVRTTSAPTRRTRAMAPAVTDVREAAWRYALEGLGRLAAR